MNRTLGFALGLLIPASSAFGQTVLVNSFETPANLAGIAVRDSNISQTTKGVTDGKSALEIDFLPGSWPAIGLMSATPADWSNVGGIAFDVSNLSSTALPIQFALYDIETYHGSTGEYGSGYTIPAGTAVNLFMPFGSSVAPNPKTYGMKALPPPVYHPTTIGWAMPTGFNMSDICSLSFCTPGSTVTQSMTVDNIRLTPPFSPSSLNGMLDAYGQYSKWGWTGKLLSSTEFVTRAALEATTLAAHPAASNRDKWGGWSAGTKSTATGYFHTAQVGGKWWLVDPDGNLFFSAGVDCVDGTDGANATITQGRTTMFQTLPATTAAYGGHYTTAIPFGGATAQTAYSFYTANLERKYGSSYATSWRTTTTARLKSWGFNTLGNWSDDTYCRADILPYTTSLNYSSSTHAHVPTTCTVWSPIDDAFDPKFATDVVAGIGSHISPYKSDPYCIGYFVDNEMSWIGSGVNARYGLAIGALALNSTASPAKQAFVGQLEAKYSTIAKFNTAWGTKFTAWSQLNAPYTAPATLTSAMTTDMGNFVLTFASQYFQIISSAIKKYDTHHLYLGCRFCYYTPETVQAAAKYCDIVSFNYYAPQLNTSDWSFLTTMGKPALIGEFNTGATDRGPIAPSLVDAGSQTGRASMYQTYVNSVLANPAIVGCHWYQYVDQPVTGRTGDGENFNSGLVDVTDTPYPELTNAAQTLNAQIYTVRGAAS